MGGGVGERAGAVSVSVQPKQIIDPPSASAATLPAIVGLVLLADGIFGKRRGRGESLIGRGRRLEDYVRAGLRRAVHRRGRRSEEHTSELQSLMRISYAVFCLKKKKKYKQE